MLSVRSVVLLTHRNEEPVGEDSGDGECEAGAELIQRNLWTRHSSASGVQVNRSTYGVDKPERHVHGIDAEDPTYGREHRRSRRGKSGLTRQSRVWSPS